MSLVNDMLLDLDNRTHSEIPDHFSGSRDHLSRSASRLFWPGCVAVALLVGSYFLIDDRFAISFTQRNHLSPVIAATENGNPHVTGTKNTTLTQPILFNTAMVDSSIPAGFGNAESVSSGFFAHSVEEDPQISAALLLRLLNSAVLPVAEKEGNIQSETLTLLSQTTQGKIDQLLAEASRALALDQLTSPLNNNAFARYQTVLLLDRDNEFAMQGIDSIVKRYFEFYRVKYQQGHLKQAYFYLTKATQISADYPVLATWLDESKQQFIDGLATAKVVAVDDQPDSTLVHQKKNVANSANKITSQTSSDIAASGDVGENSAAGEMISRDRSLLAQVAFDESQLLIKQGNLVGAISRLEENQPAKNSNPNYFSLLAALYQKVGRNEEAVKVYQSLLSIDDRKANYWLGLAVSLDATQNSASALNAFRAARQFGAGSNETQEYIAARIAQLSNP